MIGKCKNGLFPKLKISTERKFKLKKLLDEMILSNNYRQFSFSQERLVFVACIIVLLHLLTRTVLHVGKQQRGKTINESTSQV